MSLDMKSVHVRLEADAYEALRMVAYANGNDLGAQARILLTEQLLGSVYRIRKLLADTKGLK